jgi:quinol monooxygenase YgiN
MDTNNHVNTIKVDKDKITLINVFTVDPSKQQQLIDALIKTTQKVWRLQDGFISASIHKSKDGKKVINYVQYEGKEAFDKRLDNPEAIIHMNKVLSMAKADGHLYDVVFTDNKETK